MTNRGQGWQARDWLDKPGLFPVGLRISVCSYLVSKLGSLSSVCYLATSPTSPNRAHNPTPRFLLCPRHHPRHHPRRPATRPPPRTTHSTSARRTLGVVQTQCSSPPRSLPPGPAPLAFPYIFRSGPAPQICPPTFPASYLAAPHGPPPPGCGDTIDEWPPPTRHCEIPFNLSVRELSELRHIEQGGGGDGGCAERAPGHRDSAGAARSLFNSCAPMHRTHSHAACALPPRPNPAGFAIQKRACLQGQARRRRRQKAAACKQAWAAAHRDLTLQHAAAALLRQQTRRQLPVTIVDDSADDIDTDEACCAAADSWEHRDGRH